MPRKTILRRAPSRVARHGDVALTSCDAPLTVRLSPSAYDGYPWLVLYRCEACDAEAFSRHDSAPAVQVVRVVTWLDEPVTLDGPVGWQDAPEYQDPDPGPYGV